MLRRTEAPGRRPGLLAAAACPLPRRGRPDAGDLAWSMTSGAPGPNHVTNGRPGPFPAALASAGTRRPGPCHLFAGLHLRQGADPPMGIGDGGASPSPPNRGRGHGRVPDSGQIGDGDGGASPPPGKSGTDAPGPSPSPSPDKSGTGTGTGTGVSAPCFVVLARCPARGAGPPAPSESAKTNRITVTALFALDCDTRRGHPRRADSNIGSSQKRGAAPG